MYAFLIGNVIEPHEYKLDFPGFLANPSSRKRCAWSYIGVYTWLHMVTHGYTWLHMVTHG